LMEQLQETKTSCNFCIARRDFAAQGNHAECR
jgi:hypothetical protein